MSESMEVTQSQQRHLGGADSIISFKVKFDAGEVTRSKSLFGNGRMQVKVQGMV